MNALLCFARKEEKKIINMEFSLGTEISPTSLGDVVITVMGHLLCVLFSFDP